MKATHRVMIVLFVMFLPTAPLILSSHGQVPFIRVVDKKSSSVLKQEDSKTSDASGTGNILKTAGTDKSSESDKRSVAIQSVNADAGGKANTCSLLFCRRCEEAGGTCIHTDHGCYCE